MGKLINYWMEYEAFLKVAEKALSIGLLILKKVDGVMTKYDSIDAITRDCNYYAFCTEEYNGEITSPSVMVIDAGFSDIDEKARYIMQNNISIPSGMYNSAGDWVECPRRLSEAFNILAETVESLCPDTEITDTYISRREENYMQKAIYKRHVNITPYCLELKERHNYSMR